MLTPAGNFPMRPYQDEAVARGLDQMDGGLDPAWAIPTGGGKTPVVAMAGHLRASRTKRRQLFVVHRGELAGQLIRWLGRVDPDVAAGREAIGLEKADSYADRDDGGRDRWRKPKYVVAMVQSLGPRRRRVNFNPDADEPDDPDYEVVANRLKAFDPAEFSTVFIDEAHHADNPIYAGTASHFRQNPACRFGGCSATWIDSDGNAKGASCGFNAVAFRMRVAEMIAQGWLVRPIAIPIRVTGIDWGDVRTSADGIYSAEGLEKRLVEEGPLHKIVLPVLEKCGNRNVLAYGLSKRHVRALKAVFERYRPGDVRMVFDGDGSDDRESFSRDFGRLFKIGVNCSVYTEGVDLPLCNAVAVCRPCQSEVLAAQVVGRSLRVEDGLLDHPDRRDRLWHDAEARLAAIAASNKPDAHVYDFVSLGARKLLTTVDVLGDYYPPQVREYANRLHAAGGGGDVLEVLERASDEWSLITEEIARRSKIRAAGVRYETAELDLFDPRSGLEAASTPSVAEALSPTDAQVGFLVSRGWRELKARSLSRKAANAVISKLKAKEAKSP